MKTTLFIGAACLAAAVSFAQEDAGLAVAMGPVTATKPVVEIAQKDGKGDILDALVRGVETALTAELSNNDSPFALVGGNIGANLYKKIVIDQKTEVATEEDDDIQYGLSVEITAFADARTGPTQSGGLTVVQREITVMASAIMHDVGRMKAAIAIPAVSASGRQVYQVRSENELAAAAAQSDMVIGATQKDLAKKLAAGLLAAYHKFPAYVIAVDGDEATIDQGAAWCKEGDVLTLYGPPTEAEKSGRGRMAKAKTVMVPGKRVGTLTVTEVFGDASRCKLDGQGAEIGGVAYKKGDKQ